ncbi:MAG: serine hydrolase domain-containing protein [Lysobacteraceae bacterium]
MCQPLCSALAVAAALFAIAACTADAAVRYDFRPVTTEMQSLVDTYTLDGASLRVDKAGTVVYRRAFGGYALDTRIPIASASKWLSALTVARLVEKGQMRWSDTVGQYFPTVEAAKQGITLEQLFSHTSALPGGDDVCLSNPLYTLATCADRILQQPLIGQPGKVFSYGGNSMQVAGRMAEIATGKRWDDLFIAEMVTPFGLTGTDYATSSTAPGYVRNANPRIAGGVRSTLDDYGKVVDMVLGWGCFDYRTDGTCLPGRRFLTRLTIESMARDRTVGTVDVSRPPTATGYGYGLGQWIDPASPLVVSSPGAFGFTPWVDHDTQVAGVLLVKDQNTRLSDDIDDIRHMVNVVTSPAAALYIADPLPAQPVATFAAKATAVRVTAPVNTAARH